MTIKKIGVFIGTVGLITALVIGCGSSNTNTNENNSTGAENNSTEIGLEAGNFYGATFSFILKGLANGMLSYATGDVMGNFLALLGGGDSGNAEEMNELKNIDSKLTQISNELVTIEGELEEILTDIKVSEDSIKNDVDWPRDAVNNITTATQALQELGVDVNGTKIKPGEGNHTKIANLASDILSAGGYDIPLQVMSIYNAIEGNPTPLLSNYIDQVMLQLPNNDNENLQNAYQGFEYYTSELLNYQIKGINLVVEAYKAQDDNASAQKYLNCYDSDMYGTSECNLLYKEIGDMDNKTSFIYNAVSLVLKDAPVYDPFLPTSAESILKRAEFYRLLMTGTNPKKFGLRIFYISTADMEKAPDALDANGPGDDPRCDLSSRHTVKGREYDFWNDNTVKPSQDYNVVEYNCGHVPNGKYSIYDHETLLGYAEVSQYDTNYDLNSSGTISYGFGLVTNNIANRFTLQYDNWHTQTPSADNYYSWYKIHMPDSWSIETKATGGEYTSKARVELDGKFTYGGSNNKTIYVDYDMQFYVDANSPFYNSQGGGDAYCYYKIGIYDSTASKGKVQGTNYRLHAGPDHHYWGTHNVKKTMSFTAEPGHTYFVYINIISEVSAPDYVYSKTNLNSIDHIYIRF